MAAVKDFEYGVKAPEIESVRLIRCSLPQDIVCCVVYGRYKALNLHAAKVIALSVLSDLFVQVRAIHYVALRQTVRQNLCLKRVHMIYR